MRRTACICDFPVQLRHPGASSQVNPCSATDVVKFEAPVQCVRCHAHQFETHPPTIVVGPKGPRCPTVLIR